VEVPEGGGIPEALMAYMQISEQLTTMIAVGTVLGEEGVVSAGGYLVQLLPGAERGPLLVMSERLEEFRSINDRLARGDFSPVSLTDELLHAMPFSPLGETDVRFECWCSRVGVVTALATLPRAEVESLTLAGEVLEIRCDYCTTEYRIAPAELRGLLDSS
jgi:molecular chaperone Hsp33